MALCATVPRWIRCDGFVPTLDVPGLDVPDGRPRRHRLPCRCGLARRSREREGDLDERETGLDCLPAARLFGGPSDLSCSRGREVMRHTPRPGWRDRSVASV